MEHFTCDAIKGTTSPPTDFGTHLGDAITFRLRACLNTEKGRKIFEI